MRIDPRDLARVVGGTCGDYQQVNVPGGSVTQCTSEYAVCSQTAAELARRQYPDTRPALGPLASPFHTDTNASQRAAQTAANVATMCPRP